MEDSIFNLMMVPPLVVAVLFPYLLFVFLFSALGYGIEVYDELADHYEYALGVFALGLLILGTLYMLDYSFWQGRYIIIFRNAMVSIAIVCLFAGVILSAKEYPAFPMCAFMITVPAYLWAIKAKLLPSIPNSEYMGTLGIAVGLVSFAGVVTFIGWAADGRWWDPEVEEDIGQQIGCRFVNGTYIPDDATDIRNSDDSDEACLGAFMLWGAPMIYSFAGAIGAIALYYLANMTRSRQKTRAGNGLRVFLSLFILSLLGLWIAASIMGAESGLANVVVMFSGAGIVVLIFLTVRTLGMEEIRRMMENVAVVKKFLEHVHSDWARACFLITCGFPFAALLVISALNQFIRVRIVCCTPLPTDPAEYKLVFTKAFSNIIERMRGWRWSSVLRKVMWLGVIFVMLVVGVGKVTTVFLSWLNVALESFPLAATIGIFYLVGIIMFLLPPVPGVPVYLFGGILLVNAAEDSWGFVPSIFVVVAIGASLKFIAITIQQKIIGENMGKSVTVRKLVAINSLSIRAIKLILSKPGISLPKVFILCGGPDWPTSVLTGILGLNIWQMLLGSTPVVIQSVAPTVVAGAFLLRSSLGGAWESLSSLTLALAALLQACTILGAVYYIEQTASERREELQKMPVDKEVEELEKKDERRLAMYLFATDWHAPNFPWLIKVVQILGAVLMSLSCYILQLLGNRCFRQYELTDTIEDKLDGNALNIVLHPFGTGALGLFALAMVLNTIVGFWADGRVKNVEYQKDFEAANPVLEHADPEDAKIAEPAAPQVEAAEPAAPQVETAEPAAPQVEAAEPAAPQVETSKPAAPQVETAEPAAPQVVAAEPAAPQVETSKPAAPQTVAPAQGGEVQV